MKFQGKEDKGKDKSKAKDKDKNNNNNNNKDKGKDKGGGHGKEPTTTQDKGVKILAQVSGIPAGTTELIATLQIVNDGTINKTVTLEEVDEDEGVMFNKVAAKVGDAYTMTINGSKVAGTITEAHKPNKIPVALS